MLTESFKLEVEMGLSTVYRFKKNGCINIARTVYETAKKLRYDEVSAIDIELELVCQGVDIPHINIGSGASKRQISFNQIKSALSNLFDRVGKGWYKFE